jgi:hypothetical protein
MHASELRAHVEDMRNKRALLSVLRGQSLADWQREDGDMPLTDMEITEIARRVANWDYQNGPGVEPAYTVALPAADTAEKARAIVPDLAARPPVEAAPVDPAAIEAAMLSPRVLSAIAEATADVLARRAAE